MSHAEPTPQKANLLCWTIAGLAAGMPAGTVFAAAFCAIAGIRLSQELLGCRLALCGRGGAYDARGILSLHARHWLFNRSAKAYVDLQGVFDTLSAPHALFATPAQIDGEANANLSGIGDHSHPKVAFGGTRGLPDARTIHFVVPSYGIRQLVKNVSFVSTCAATRETPALLITEDCVFRWNPPRRGWILESIAPGLEIPEIRSKVGFSFDTAANVQRLPPPPPEAVALLECVDPLSLRTLDFATCRQDQLDTIARVFAMEADMITASR
jgi:hypothetical protein